MDDYGYALRTGRGKDLKYWYRDPSTGKLYEGPKPRPALVRAKPQHPVHPGPSEIEPCPWEGLGRTTNHELIVIPGPPEVLYNKLGLTSAEDVHPIEGRGVLLAFDYMAECLPGKRPITVAGLRKLHKIAFGELYSWAGECRTVWMSKEGKFPYDWPPPGFIVPAMEHFEQEFLSKLTPVSKEDRADVPRRVAVLISEFLQIHPFREGNGRIAQLLGNWAALQAGLPTITYGIDDDTAKKDAYIYALRKAYNQDYALLEQFVQEGIDRSLRALRMLKLGPSLPEEPGSAPE